MCWSTVIAAADTHDAFGEAPDNGWVQRCRLGSGHAGIHASDAAVGPLGGLRLWLQWSDEDDNHRLTELEPCPDTDGADLACAFFAGHGGPHRYVPTSPSPRFGSHYRSDTTVGLNGSRRAGSIATVESLTVPAGASPGPNPVPSAEEHQPQHESAGPAPELFDAPRSRRRSRHSDEPEGDVAQRVAEHATEHVRPVDEVLVDLVELLSELAAAIRASREF